LIFLLISPVYSNNRHIAFIYPGETQIHSLEIIKKIKDKFGKDSDSWPQYSLLTSNEFIVEKHILNYNPDTIICFGVKCARFLNKKFPSTYKIFCGVPKEALSMLNNNNFTIIDFTPSLDSIISLILEIDDHLKDSIFYFISNNPEIYNYNNNTHKIKKIKINSKYEIIEKIRCLKENDILILAPESTFIDKPLIKRLVAFSLKKHFIMVVPYPAMVKLGGTLSIYYDYTETVSENIFSLLSHDSKKVLSYKPKIYINKKAAKYMKLKLKLNGWDYEYY